MSLQTINCDLKILKQKLKVVGVPQKIITSIETRALRSGRRTTGPFKSNRQSRWNLLPEDPQYGTEEQSKLILIKLLTTLMQFEDSPISTPNVYCDPLTLEVLNYKDFESECLNPTHGVSNYHLGHQDPTQHPKHTVDNVAWMTRRSNLIQGDMTITQARNELLAIYKRIKNPWWTQILGRKRGR